MRKICFVAVVVSWMFFAGAALAVSTAASSTPDTGPMAALKGPIEQVIDILADPRYKDGAHSDEQLQRLWDIAHEIFDFEAIARGTLKRHRWQSFTPKQREEFTDVFTDFLGNNYFNQIKGKYRNERVVFVKETMKSDTKALVETKILRDAVEIPVDYSMWTRGGTWRIYNVIIEGASLLGNYRNEFERVLQNDPPDHLISLLKEKTEALKSQEAGK
jgi:phospholipid transport system substrate-binding protein